MKPFGIALRLWGGTLLIHSGTLGVFGLFTLNSELFLAALITFVFGVIFTFPLLLSSTGLVRLSALLPYRASARIWWLAFMLLLQNFGYFRILGYVISAFYEMYLLHFLFFTTSFAMIIMLCASRTLIKNFYSQQTTSNKQL